MNILIGHERESRKPIYIPSSALERHLHLIGFTGAGKTTAIITLLVQLFCDPVVRRCAFILDRLGGFSTDLLRWVSSSFCPQWVRDRVVYLEGSREDIAVPLYPLRHSTPGEGYYRTARTAEMVMRGWDSQDLSQMPRLMRWLFNSMFAMSKLGLAVTDAVHLLFTHSPLHRPLLSSLPPALQYEWRQISEARGQSEIHFESCRNRLKPFADCPSLHNMFASTDNRFDVPRWMREGKIVIINLAPMGKLPETAADTMGGLIVNECLSVARSLPQEERREMLLVLDEFQRFVRGSDLEFALAESRQLRTSLVLSHQSFSQLKTENVDLTSLILQAQTRMILKVAGLDADIVAEELANFAFDPMAVKDEIYHRCQRVSGHRVVELESRSMTDQFAKSWNEQHGQTWNRHQGHSDTTHQGIIRRDGNDQYTRTQGKGSADNASQGKGGSEAHGTGGSESHSQTRGVSQSLVPVFEEFVQLASRTYSTFDEKKHEWGRDVRRLRRGQCFLQIADRDEIFHVDIKRTAPGHLAFRWEDVVRRIPEARDMYERLLEQNFRQDCFVSAAQIESEREARLQRILNPPILLLSDASGAPCVSAAQISDEAMIIQRDSPAIVSSEKNPLD